MIFRANGLSEGVFAPLVKTLRGARRRASALFALLRVRRFRTFPALILAASLAGCVASADLAQMSPEQHRKRVGAVRPDWRAHFEDVSAGAILINVEQRWLVFWEPGGVRSHAFPIAVPLTDELTRTGETKVVRRKEGPSWTATPEMIERNPEVPRYIAPGPGNPLGEYALYLGWRYYAIHGTNTPGAIGDRATSGCFRLFNEDIKWLFNNVELGTPVVVVNNASVNQVARDSVGVSGSPSRALPESATNPPALENGGPGAYPTPQIQSTPILDNPPAARPISLRGR